MAQRLPTELRISTTTRVGKVDPSRGVLLQYHISHVDRDDTVQSSVRARTTLLHRYNFGRQSRPKGEGLASGGIGYSEELERKPTAGTKLTEGVRRRTSDREDF